MNTVCALPGCPNLFPEEQAQFRRGYCDQHLAVGVIAAVDETRELLRELTEHVLFRDRLPGT